MNQLFSIQYGFPLLLTGIYFLCLLLNGLGKVKISQVFFLFISALYIGLVRFYDYQYLWSNPDVDQWIICARSLVDDPFLWMKEYAIYDFTRLLTILPLSMIYWVFGSLGYFEVSVFFLISLFVFIVLQTQLLSRKFESNVVFLSVGLLLIYIVMSDHHNMRAFNSELPVVLLLSAAMVLWFTNKPSATHFFWIGWLLSMMPFAKEQALYIALMAFIVIGVDALRNKRWRWMSTMIVGSLAGGFLWMIVLLSVVGMDAIMAVVSSIAEYGQMGLRQQLMGTAEKIQIFTQVIWFNKEMLVLFPTALVGIIVSGVQCKKKHFERPVFFFFVLVFFVACYVIYLPHNRFTHYQILMWPTLPYFIAVFIAYWKVRLKRYVYYLLPIFLFPFALDVAFVRLRSWYPEEKDVEKIAEWKQDPYVQAMLRHHVFEAKTMVWGWDNRAMVLNNNKRASGFLYPQYAYGKYTGTARVRSNYLHFVQLEQPTFVLELVGEGRYFFNDRKQYGIQETFPALHELLMEHYFLLEAGNNFKLYKRI